MFDLQALAEVNVSVTTLRSFVVLMFSAETSETGSSRIAWKRASEPCLPSGPGGSLLSTHASVTMRLPGGDGGSH